MTWLMFELARNPELQEQVHQEIDDFFTALQGRDPTYSDLSKLPLLDKCITETLRLWPAVANGTFRQLQSADSVTGRGGKRVKLDKGCNVNIVNWSRHRNPVLWGPDAECFNPYRDFTEAEMTHVGCPMAAMNPQSSRFSPFAHNPRSCLGKNFAQMEMRLILPYCLQRFHFKLAAPYDSLYSHHVPTAAGDINCTDFRGVNRGGTMGPKNLEDDQEGTSIAMKLDVTLRNTHN